MHVRRVFLAPLLALALAACAHPPTSFSAVTAPTLQGDAAHPPSAKGGWTRSSTLAWGRLIIPNKA